MPYALRLLQSTPIIQCLILFILSYLLPGPRCRSLTDWRRTTQPKNRKYRIWPKPCSEKRYYLCEMSGK